MFYLLQLTEEEEMEALRGEVICISFCNSVSGRAGIWIQVDSEAQACDHPAAGCSTPCGRVFYFGIYPSLFLSCSPWWCQSWEFREFLLGTPPFPFWSVLVRVLFYRLGERSRLQEAWYWSGISRNRATRSTQFVSHSFPMLCIYYF